MGILLLLFIWKKMAKYRWTGRKFYELGFRDAVLAHDNNRSYSYGKKDWASGTTEPKEEIMIIIVNLRRI